MEGAVGGIWGFWTRSLIRGPVSVWGRRVVRYFVWADALWLPC